MKWLLSLSICLFLSSVSYAETIEFDEEELSTESVLPVFEHKSVVKNRLVSLSNRFELGAGLGLNLIEALYQPMTVSLIGTYHLDELNGINIFAQVLNTSLSDMGQNLKNGKILGQSGATFDASRAPAPQSLVLANYQFSAYYGKISLTKQTVMNISLYGLIGAGIMNFEDGSNAAFNVGFGQKFYFNENVALRFDLQLTAYQGPDATSKLPLTTGGPKLTESDFEKEIMFRSFLTANIVFLL